MVRKEEKKKKRKKIILFVLINLLFLLMGFVGGLIIGEEAGEQKIVMNFAKMFGGAEFDIDVNMNETRLVDIAKEHFKGTLIEELNKRNLICGTG